MGGSSQPNALTSRVKGPYAERSAIHTAEEATILQICGIYIPTRRTLESFLPQKFSINAAKIMDNTNPTGTVTNVMSIVFTRESMNHSSEKSALKLLSQIKFQFPKPLVKFQSVRLIKRDMQNLLNFLMVLIRLRKQKFLIMYIQ